MNVMAQAHKATKAMMVRYASMNIQDDFSYREMFKACLKVAHREYKIEQAKALDAKEAAKVAILEAFEYTLTVTKEHMKTAEGYCFVSNDSVAPFLLHKDDRGHYVMADLSNATVVATSQVAAWQVDLYGNRFHYQSYPLYLANQVAEIESQIALIKAQ